MVMSRFNQQHGFDEASNTRSTTCLTNEINKTSFPAIFRWSFGLKALVGIAVFTVSLVVLPLVLPPLPPPPPLVLFIPVLIMLVLVFLAFAPSELPPDDVICSGWIPCNESIWRFYRIWTYNHLGRKLSLMNLGWSIKLSFVKFMHSMYLSNIHLC